MNDEYHYQRGVGWVLGPAFETLEVTYYDGKQARLEARIPRIGERFHCGWGAMYIKEPKVPNLQTWAELAKLYKRDDATACDAGDIEHYDKLGRGVTGWVTIVPI